MEGSPNPIAWLVLALCIPVSVFGVLVKRPAISVPILILAGQMFLPTMIAFDAPLIPPFGKDILVPFGALVGCYFFRRSIFRGSRPFRGYDILILTRLIGLLGTYLTNGDAIRIGATTLPAITFYDWLSSSIKETLYWWPPFFLGRVVIRTSEDLKRLFVIVAGAGVVYTIFMLPELVVSPQLNRWIYGYHQTSFIMAIRGGGYRPMVFMRHGLNVAFFMAITILAAGSLTRIGGRVFGVRARFVAIYLLIVLILCHSLGSLLYAAAGLPLVWLARPRAQAKVAALVALLAFSYPIARAADLLPVDAITTFIRQNFGEDRAGSLGLRLSEESWLMERALKRIVFGWGGYARPFRHDPITGVNTSITDGIWAIEIGSNGAVGFVSLFGLILLPAWRARKVLRTIASRDDQYLIACLGFMAAIYGFELIPNSSMDPYLTFMVGVLAGIDMHGLAPAPQAQPRQAWAAAGGVVAEDPYRPLARL